MGDEEGLQRNVFWWIGSDDPFKERSGGVPLHKTITADEVVKKHGVPWQTLQQYIESEIKETEDFSSLPFTLFFVIAYAIMVIIHDEAVVVRAVEDSISFDIVDNANFAFDSPDMAHKDITDVGSIPDFWSWTAVGFIPLMFAQEDGLAEGRNESDPIFQNISLEIPEEDWGYLLNYNRLIGGVRFSQERGQFQECPHKSAQKFWNKTCTGLAYELDPETWDARGIKDPKNVTWFYVHEQEAFLQERLIHMEAAGWVDRATQKVEIAIPIYTAEFGLHTLVTVNFFFSRGGHVAYLILAHSAYAGWFQFPLYAVYDILWLLCLFHIFRTEVKEVYQKISLKGWRALFTEYLSFWNVVDWISVFGGIVIVALVVICITGTTRCNHEVILLAEMDPHGDAENYRLQVDYYVNALTDVVYYAHIFKLVLAAYPMVIVLRLFKAFSAQPRLALVTNTLYITGVDLLHFMLVFTSIFITLAISGLVMFGRRLQSFATFPRAMNTLFRLMLGDFDWEELKSVGEAEGGIWLVITLSMMNLLLLNMVLAIVMDGYSEVKSTTKSHDTVFTEIYQIWSRWLGVRAGRFVHLQDINLALVQMGRNMERRLGARKFRKGGRVQASDLDGPILLGRDTKVVVGMRVEPVDEDIAKVLHSGKVHAVGQGGLKCRVEHEDGRIQEYNIGQDMEYELQLAPGEAPVEIDDDEEHTAGTQVLSVERFIKEVHQIGGSRMGNQQAYNLLKAAVNHYYKSHCEDVDLDHVRQLLHKVMFRAKKIKRVFQSGGGGQSVSLHAADETRLLRQQLHEFYTAVDEDRRAASAEMERLKAEIKTLSATLRRVEPERLHELKESLPIIKAIEPGSGPTSEVVEDAGVDHPSPKAASMTQPLEEEEQPQVGLNERKGSLLSLTDMSEQLNMHEIFDDDDPDDEELLREVDLLLEKSADVRHGRQLQGQMAVDSARPFDVRSVSSGSRNDFRSDPSPRVWEQHAWMQPPAVPTVLGGSTSTNAALRGGSRRRTSTSRLSGLGEEEVPPY